MLGSVRSRVASRALISLSLLTACEEVKRAPPARRLTCEEDPRCAPSRAGSPSGSTEVGAFLERCLEDQEGEPVGATLGTFGPNFDPTDLDAFRGRAEVYGIAETSGKYACSVVSNGAQFELFGAAVADGPLRIDPSGGALYSTLLNHVDFQDLPLKIPVFTSEHIDALYEDLGAERDLKKGTIVIEVQAPPGLFTDGRARHAGARFTASDAEQVAYLVEGRWQEVEQTSEAGLAALINVKAAPELGTRVKVVQEGEDGSTLERQLWSAEGAITFALLFNP